MKAAGSTPPASASSPPAANGASRPGLTPAASSPPPGRTCRCPQSPRKPSPERRFLPPAQAFLPAKTRERFASPNADAAVLARAGVNRIHCPEQGECERLQHETVQRDNDPLTLIERLKADIEELLKS